VVAKADADDINDMDSVGTDSSFSSDSDSSDSSISDSSSSDSSSPDGATSQDLLTDTKSISRPAQKDELLTKEFASAGNKNIPREIRFSPNSSPNTTKMKRNLLEIQAPHDATTANPSNDKQDDIKAVGSNTSSNSTSSSSSSSTSSSSSSSDSSSSDEDEEEEVIKPKPIVKKRRRSPHGTSELPPQ